jgi:hypothetical protein
MEPLGMITVLSARTLTGQAHSALPGAPVVEPVERERATTRTRAAAAASLRHLADAVAPSAGTPLCADGH